MIHKAIFLCLLHFISSRMSYFLHRICQLPIQLFFPFSFLPNN
jgi:hypothetical protein